MGAHARPRHGIDGLKGRHRGEPEPLLEMPDLSAVAVKTGTVLAAGATLATVGATGAFAATATSDTSAREAAGPAATASDFAALRQCESGGNYATNTGNGYYGAYQFDLQTWHSLGYSGLPSAASPATQDAAAAKLESERGWQPWPACSAKLGLGKTVSTTPLQRTTATPAAVAPRSASSHSSSVSVHVAGGVPSFPGTVLSTRLEHAKRSDVAIWQARMVRRGWHLKVDGRYGPQTAKVAREFAAEKGIAATHGTVNARVWSAAWTAPVTR